MFVSSHVLAEVAQTVDQVVIINKGRLITVSPLAELLAQATSGVHVIAPEAGRLHDLLREHGIDGRPPARHARACRRRRYDC